MTELRPISLCNMVYKIISKVLANRLKVLLPKIISPFQSAFVPGRAISDNTILASEIANFLYKRPMGKKSVFALKLDMCKAYNKIELSYLECVMLKLGFNTKWVNLIMMCISSVSYSFIVNGSPMGYMLPSHGLRQGGPISPYIYSLCAEGLSTMIAKYECLGAIQGISNCQNAPLIHHLFFVDDCFVFMRARREDCLLVKSILNSYENA